MPTWTELDQQFRELVTALQFTRLDFQWGAAGIYYRLAGGGVSDATRRFEALARIAGSKLSELPRGTLHEDVWQREAALERWYEALKHHSGAFEHGHFGSQHDADGTFRGHIFSGHIQTPVTASGVLALELSAVPIPAPQPPAVEQAPVEPRRDLWSRINDRLAYEAEKRGRLWAVVATIAALVIAVLSLM
jgi:hypothetical protein